MAPALLSYVLQTSLRITFGTRKPFFRAAGAMIPQSCQPVGTHCDLHLGKAHLHRPGVQQICSGTGSYKHLPKRCCTVRSVGAPGANPGTVDPVAPSSRCSVHDVSLRSGRRPRSLGSCQGSVLWEMGFRRVCRVPWPPARCESKAADASLPWWRAVPEQRANATTSTGWFQQLRRKTVTRSRRL